jgi:hypothetical protein
MSKVLMVWGLHRKPIKFVSACNAKLRTFALAAAAYQENRAQMGIFFPISLQRVYTDLSRVGNVGMKYLGQEEPCGNGVGARGSDVLLSNSGAKDPIVEPFGGELGKSPQSTSLTLKQPPW